MFSCSTFSSQGQVPIPPSVPVRYQAQEAGGEGALDELGFAERDRVVYLTRTVMRVPPDLASLALAGKLLVAVSDQDVTGLRGGPEEERTKQQKSYCGQRSRDDHGATVSWRRV